jgi:tetratricopeptide (TPR) repeat protein
MKVDSYELREEIKHGGRIYFLQTSFLPAEKHVRSSFFKDGALFDTVVQRVEDIASPEELKGCTKEIHLRNKKRFLFLLGAREKIKAYKDPAPHLKLAQALLKKKLYTEAIQEANLAIQKGDKNSTPYMVIGESFYMLGDLAKALDAVKRGIIINPEYPDLHNLIGQIYLQQKKCRSAIESFKHAIGLNLYYGEPYFNLARAYLLNSIVKEDYELSRDLKSNFTNNLERAFQLNPFLEGEVLKEAKKLFEDENYDEAYKMLESVPRNAGKGGVDEITLELYLMLLMSDDRLPADDVENCLKRVGEIIDQNPSFADAYNSLGILYTAKCKLFMDKASEAFRKALELNKNYRKAQKNLRLMENDRQGIFILLKALLD